MSRDKSVLVRMGERFGVDANKMLETLKATAFKGEVTNEQMMALLIVAEQHGLNPWTKEIYAFPDKKNGIVPVVGVDGWTRIINSNNQFDGVEFVDSESLAASAEHKPCPEWIECVIYRKDRTHAIRVREYFDECYRAPFKNDKGYTSVGPWQSHTKRMLRHKALIQCARIAFSFGGVYDQDEAEAIIEKDITPAKQSIGAQRINGILAAQSSEKIEHALPERSEKMEIELNKTEELQGEVA